MWSVGLMIRVFLISKRNRGYIWSKLNSLRVFFILSSKKKNHLTKIFKFVNFVFPPDQKHSSEDHTIEMEKLEWNM